MSDESWTTKPLGELAFEAKDRVGSDSTGLSVYGVDRHEGLTGETKYVAASLDRYKLIEPGMFAYNPMRLNIGSIGFCKPSFRRGLVSPDYIVFGCKHRELHPEFLNYAIRGPEWVQWTSNAGVGSVRQRIYFKELARLPITIPPYQAQRAIVSVLSALDEKIAANRQMNETLEALAYELFQTWFVEATQKGLPKNWRKGVLSDLVSTVIGGDWGKDQPTEEETEPAFCIRGADIPSLQRCGTEKMPVRYLKSSSLEKRQMQDGDLVVEISGGSPTQSTGRPVLVSASLLRQLEYPLVCSNFCRGVKLKSKSASKFIYLWLRWLYDRDAFLQYENGTTGIKNFAFTIFSEKFTLVIPPPDTLEAFDKHVSPLFERAQANGSESATLAALRDALLPKLLSGELRVPGVHTKEAAK